MDRKDAFKKITSDRALAKRFTEDPQQVLKELQVDTSGLKITMIPKEQAQITDVKPESPQREPLLGCSGCVSIGCVVCPSIGS